MIEIETKIPAPDGAADAVLYHAEDGRAPGVVFLTDIGGIRDSQREMARRIAAEGYTVLLPNIFYRTARIPVFDFPIRLGEVRTTQRFTELSAPLTPEAMNRDAAAYVDFLAGQDSVSPGGMGVVGFCFSGAMAMRTAAMRPDQVAAAASFHGGRLYTDDPTSPHLLLPQIKARLYFGHAIEDRSMPAEAIEGLNRALKAWGGKYESEVYEGARHGWTVPDNPAYNPPQAGRALGKLSEIFNEVLKTDPRHTSR